jgi:uncharacterized protein
VAVLLRTLARFVVSYHKFLTVVFVILTAVSLITVANMEIKTDVIDVLPNDNETVARFKDFMQDYGVLDNITLIVESENSPVEEHLDLVESIAERLKTSPLIDFVDYSPLTANNEFFFRHFPLFLDESGLRQLRERLTPEGIEHRIRLNRQRLLSPLGTPLDSELISRDPLRISEIVMASMKRTHKNESLDLSAGYYVTKDHAAALIIAKPKGKSRDVAFVKKLKKELDALIKVSLEEHNNPPGVKIGLTGSHIISEEIRGVIQHDIISSSILSVVLIALLIWLVYRVRAGVLAVIGATLLASLSMTLAIAYLMFGSLNIVTSIVAAVLIGLYVDYSMHMVKRYGDELLMGSDRQRALEITLVRTGPGIIVSACTTSLSFFSIIMTQFEGLYELGLVAGIGVLLCLISNLFLMSSLLIWLTDRGTHKIVSSKKVTSGTEKLHSLIIRWPRLILASSMLAIFILGLGLTKVRFDNDPDHIGVRSSSPLSALKALSERLDKKGEPLNIIIKGEDEQELTASYDYLELLLSGWRNDGLIGRYDSLSFFMPHSDAQEIGISMLKELSRSGGMQIDVLEGTLTRSLERNGLVYDKTYIASYLSGIASALNHEERIGLKELKAVTNPRISHFYNRDTLSIAAYLYPPATGWDNRSIETIQTEITAAGSGWTVIGKSLLFSEIRTSVVRGSLLATITTLLLNIVIVYWFFRRIGYVVLVMLPVTLGFLLTPGIMGYLDVPFNFINIGTIALIFGLGVDYGIYVIQAYVGEEKRDLGNALRVSGKNVMMGAATTVAGCGSLMTAKFAGIAGIGLVLTIGAISCAVIALLFLPALLYLMGKRLQDEKI